MRNHTALVGSQVLMSAPSGTFARYDWKGPGWYALGLTLTLTVEPAATLAVALPGLSWLQRMSLLVTLPTKPLSCQFLAWRTLDQLEPPLMRGRVSVKGSVGVKTT